MIAFELARSNPDAVESLILIEPPLPLRGLSEGPPPQFLVEGVGLWQAGDHEAATNGFFEAVSSPDWRNDLAEGLPQGPAQVSQNAKLFFEDELPAFQGFLIDEEDATDFGMPILYIVSEPESDYVQVHHDRMRLIRGWLPQTETLVVPDADHALPIQQPRLIADAIATFVETHAR